MSAVPVPLSAVDPLAQAVEDLIHAKRAEEAAKKRRIEAEERILALHPAREEGSETFDAAGYKVTVTGKLTYSCDDAKALAEACADWPANLVPVKTVVELDATGCKWLRANDPSGWNHVAKFVTVKAAKPSVTVKV